MKAFFGGYTFTTHSIAALLIFLVGADKLVPSFHEFWTTVFNYLPHLAQLGLEASVGLALLYFAGRKSEPTPPSNS